MSFEPQIDKSPGKSYPSQGMWEECSGGGCAFEGTDRGRDVNDSTGQSDDEVVDGSNACQVAAEEVEAHAEAHVSHVCESETKEGESEIESGSEPVSSFTCQFCKSKLIVPAVCRACGLLQSELNHRSRMDVLTDEINARPNEMLRNRRSTFDGDHIFCNSTCFQKIVFSDPCANLRHMHRFFWNCGWMETFRYPTASICLGVDRGRIHLFEPILLTLCLFNCLRRIRIVHKEPHEDSGLRLDATY